MKKHTAFSLIELSIVILIIGILVAGITQSSRLVKKMRLNSARTQTQSSPVASIKDLALWLDTTMESSFGGSEPEESAEIATWYDTNPQSTLKYNATQGSSTKYPTYDSSAINNLPALNFDGSNDDMVVTSLNAGSNASYFFVIKPTTAHVEAVFDSAPSTGWVFRNNCASACSSDGKFEMHTGSTAPTVTLGLSALTPTVIYLQIAYGTSTRVLSYYRNGTSISSDSDSNISNAIAWANPRIGSINTTEKFYTGKIGEIIIFSRAINAEERQSVTAYLGKKWGIKTSN